MCICDSTWAQWIGMKVRLIKHKWWRTWSMFYHAVLERVGGAVHGPDSDVAPAEQLETDTSDHTGCDCCVRWKQWWMGTKCHAAASTSDFMKIKKPTHLRTLVLFCTHNTSAMQHRESVVLIVGGWSGEHLRSTSRIHTVFKSYLNWSPYVFLIVYLYLFYFILAVTKK